jgi:TRAP-type transport system periplasmic protein
MGDYIPMLSEAFWQSLTPALKSLVTDLWAANIGLYRTDLAAAQERAEATLKARNVRLAIVSPEELAERRGKMMAEQDRIAHEMKISPDILDRIMEVAAASN